MTHTEESLMALADRMYSAPAGTLKNMIEIELRLAIREVLAERDALKQSEYERVSLSNGVDDLKAERGKAISELLAMTYRAEKAEAEVERLKQELVGQAFKFGIAEDGLRKDAERYRWLRDGCDNKGTPASWIAHNHYGKDWDDAIDAAIAQEAKP